MHMSMHVPMHMFSLGYPTPMSCQALEQPKPSLIRSVTSKSLMHVDDSAASIYVSCAASEEVLQQDAAEMQVRVHMSTHMSAHVLVQMCMGVHRHSEL